MEQKTGFREIFLRLVAIVGLIAVLILGAWGIILLAFNLVGIFSGQVTLDSIFNNNNKPQAPVATTTPNVTVNNTNTGTNTGTNTPSQPNNTNTQPKPTTVTPTQPNAVYTAAPRVSQLYGLSDLKVTITSITSLSSVQGRTVVQFVVENAGTNVALAGWTFKADLPLQPHYTYQSIPQQALYPGDKIAYTLTYDDPRFQGNQYCTLQYPNPYCNYQNQYPYNYPYQQPQTCYTYNGYQNIPSPCVSYDSNGNPIYNNTNNNYYNQNYNYYNPNYGHYPYGGQVTITLDPQNFVPEANEWNNTASKNLY